MTLKFWTWAIKYEMVLWTKLGIPRGRSRFKDMDIRVKFEKHIRYASGDAERPSNIKGRHQGKGQRNSTVKNVHLGSENRLREQRNIHSGSPQFIDKEGEGGSNQEKISHCSRRKPNSVCSEDNEWKMIFKNKEVANWVKAAEKVRIDHWVWQNWGC